MKKTNYFVLCMAILACGCSSLNGGFVVKGSLEGGNVYLVSTTPGAIDTLATGVLKNGKFQLTGQVEQPMITRVIVEGQTIAPSIFLENNNTYIMQNGRVEATTEAQKEINQYDEAFQVFNELFEKLQKLHPELRKMFLEMGHASLGRFVKQNPDTELSAYLLYAIEAAGGDTGEVAGLLGENAKATVYGKALKAFKPATPAPAPATTAAAPAPTADPPVTPVGEIAPDFTLSTPGGETLSLHGVKAKLKLIDFWASWCFPCRLENRNVIKVYAEYHPKGLEIIGVSLDTDREAWLKAIEDDHLTWQHASDLQGGASPVAKLYGIKSIPFTVLVDENNKVIAVKLRGAALEAKIAELLD